ncbi:hypothetical protein D3C72_1878420 [compost metagenome]
MRKRRGAGTGAAEQVLAVAVVGIGQAEQLVVESFQRRGQRAAVGIAHGAVAGLHQQRLDVLRDGRDRLQRVLFRCQRNVGLAARRGVLAVDRLRLADAEGARGGDRVIRRREDAAAGAELLLDMQQRALLQVHRRQALLIQGGACNTHDGLPIRIR